MRKPVFCIYENKDVDQLRGNRESDQGLCFCYVASTIPLLPKYKISSLYASSVTAQPGLCQTRSETPKNVFSQRGSYKLLQAELEYHLVSKPIHRLTCDWTPTV